MSDIVLISIPETTIKNIVEQAVKKAIEDYQPQAANPQNQIVDLSGLIEARPHVGSRSTIYKKVSNGLIPHSKRGKKLFFDFAIIDQWLISNKGKTVEDVEKKISNHIKSSRK